MSPLTAHHDPLETEAHLAEHENIAIRLQEITSTFGPLLANLSEPEYRHPLPDHLQPAAGKSSKKEAPADDRDRAAVNSQDAPDDSSQAEPSTPDQTKAPSDLTDKNVFDREGQGHDLQDLPPQNSAQDLDRSVPKRKLRVKLLASVYFSSNSTELLPSEKIVLIDLLPLVRDKRLLFVGYSDRAGDDNANARLSYKRARVVKAFFAQTGHDPGKLFAGGRGSCCDKTKGNTPTGQQQNRRVEIYHTLERFRLQSPPFIKE
ncbi:MAG: OmpA family protein [Nitrospira sp.]|nr:OmpA family protein [Nitrospira sp.]